MLKIVVAVSSFFLALSLYATASDQNRNSLASLPAAAQSSISAALGRDLPSYRVREHGALLQAENAQQRLTADFNSTDVEFHTSNTTWKLALCGYGRGGDVQPE
jgi:predicted membrane-bound dolichyl-phosphate-mannose-protein mannosyltransferase